MGLPRRHPGRPRGRRLPRLRGARLGRRAADGAARRSARAGHGAALAGARRRRGGRRRRAARARCRPAGCTSSTASTTHDRAGLAGPRGLRARCAGWPSSTSSSTTPTARAATCWRWPAATATASTTASASTPSTSCAPCSGAGRASRSHDEESPASSGSRRRWTADLGERLCELLDDREVDGAAAPGAPGCCDRARFPAPSRGLAGDPVAALLTAPGPSLRGLGSGGQVEEGSTRARAKRGAA